MLSQPGIRMRDGATSVSVTCRCGARTTFRDLAPGERVQPVGVPANGATRNVEAKCGECSSSIRLKIVAPPTP